MFLPLRKYLIQAEKILGQIIATTSKYDRNMRKKKKQQRQSDKPIDSFLSKIPTT